MEGNSTAVNTNNSWNDQSSASINITNAVIGSTMIAVTLFGQIVVFIIVNKDSRLQTPNNYYVISLAFADLLISITSLPF